MSNSDSLPIVPGRVARLDLARAAYRDIPVYAPHGADDAMPAPRIDVSDNTNLWGTPPAALRTLHDAAADVVSRYPSLYVHELKRSLAAYVGVRPEEIVTGCGSDDVLDAAMRAFAEPGDRVAYCAPTFSMVPTFARMNALEPVPLAYRDDWDADADALLATRARIIYLCSPNNPTGTVVSPGVVERVAREATGLVIVDEAYGEFARTTFASRAPGWERVLVMRTLSKAFGLAGLRIGYGVGATALVREVEKARGPYMVNAAAQRAAEAALGEGLPWVREHAREAVAVRERLVADLAGRGLRPLPSEANFVLVPTPIAAALARGLRRRGVLVRLFTDLPDVGDALRVGVGPWSTMTELLAALDAVLAEETSGGVS